MSGFPTEVRDTVGAGDSHLGAFLAASLQGLDVEDALRFANRLASMVVAIKGVHLERHHHHTLEQELKKLVHSKEVDKLSASFGYDLIMDAYWACLLFLDICLGFLFSFLQE